MRYKRIVLYRHGGPEVLRLVEEDLPDPEAGEVRVRVLATGVCYADVMIREGVHPVTPPLPIYPGSEPAGVVDRCGGGVTSVREGELVAALTPAGGRGYAEYLCLPEARWVRVPEGVEPADAAALILNYLAAWQMLHRMAHVGEGDKILIHGAAGGVGTALLDLGQLAGLQMYGTASRAKFDVVERLGGVPIDYRREDFVRRVLELSQGGVHAVFDPIGGRHWERSFRTLNPDGRLIGYGFSAAFKNGRLHIPRGLAAILGMPRFSILRLLRKSSSRGVMGYVMDSYRRPDWYREDLARLLALLSEKKIRPIIGKVLPLSEARKAHELLNQAAVTGKIVLTCHSAV